MATYSSPTRWLSLLCQRYGIEQWMYCICIGVFVAIFVIFIVDVVFSLCVRSCLFVAFVVRFLSHGRLDTLFVLCDLKAKRGH